MKALPTKFGQVAQTKKEKGGVDAEGRETPCDGGKQRHGRKRYGNWWLVVVLFWRHCSLWINLLLTFVVLNFIFCSICHRETIDERGVQRKRESHAKSGASQRGTLGSLQKQQRLRQQTNAVGIPGTLCVNRGEQCLRQGQK